jgi:hypothetical protein
MLCVKYRIGRIGFLKIFFKLEIKRKKDSATIIVSLKQKSSILKNKMKGN